MNRRIGCARCLPGVLAGCLWVSGVSAAEFLVPADPACGTIQACIDAAADGDTIRVVPGVYREDVDFKGKAVTLRSLEGPEATVIEGTRADAAVVSFVAGEGNGSVLDGFTIRGGGSSHGPDLAEGVFIRNASPTVRNNRITEIPSPGSGRAICRGIYIEGGAPVIRDNRIEDNVSDAPGWIAVTTCGIHLEGASPIIEGNRIAGNGSSGGEMLSFTYGIHGSAGGGEGPVIIAGNTILKNTARAGGVAAASGVAGIALTAGESCQEIRIENNLVAGNRALPGVDAYAYGILIEDAPCGHVRIAHNTVANNAGRLSAGVRAGAGLYAQMAGDVTVVNNIFAGNHQGVCIPGAGGTTTADHNDVWNNYPDGDYCEGTLPGPHDLSLQPVFANPPEGNYHLTSGSPCIDSGTAEGGADRDIEGDLRPVGAGHDMGADEWVPTPPWTAASTAGAVSRYGMRSARLSGAVSVFLAVILPAGLLRVASSRRRGSRA